MITSKLLKYDSGCINQANRNGFTALIKAAIHGNLSCIELLLKEGKSNNDVMIIIYDHLSS